ncbi:Protein of unknown function UPF0113 [Ferroglobus placidus DSM 10642]|uniref:PUA domain-containing protein n=1 Tax=Ferroglobus placidus (strain DSM 10642 / AEDII12DO) TaxID=589924 RepID=D3S273_FERPA|nr:NIP7 N-terminal domain-related protein [Ferroglobus placidus]ADC66564.1 Protein of unknown function UPF0113 [Ferroglobus placidus DSM 10642]
MEIRRPTKKELKIIRKALAAFGSVDFLDNFSIYVKEGEKKEVYAASKDLEAFIGKLNEVSFGIKVGEVGKRFRFTLEGAFFLVKRNKKKVYVNEKGEMLFLYGRDIFRESVIDVTEDVRENDIVFVCNKRGDILGIGKTRFDAERIFKVEEGRVVVENLVDRGEYIRKEKLYDAY